MVGDIQDQFVLLEHRDTEGQEPSFSLFDLETQKPLCLQQSFGAGHWLSAWALQGQRGVFVLYAGQDNPLQQAFWVYDFAQERILWEESRYTLRRLVGDCLEVSPRQGAIERQLYLSLHNGQVQALPKYADRPTLLHWPQRYEPTDEYFEEVCQFLALQQLYAAPAPIAYWELADKAFISYWQNQKGFLAQFLAIFNADGQSLEHYQLSESQAEALSPIFFIFKKYLFFVKNKIELVSFPLKSL